MPSDRRMSDAVSPPTASNESVPVRPMDRPCPWETLDADGPLARAWTFSARRLAQIRDALQPAGLPPGIACLAVSGSLGRMEADALSDLDLLIVVDDRTQTVDSATVQETVWQLLKAAPLHPAVIQPKSGGIFSECVSWKRIVDPARRGIIDDDLTVFGQRMQLLIDAQPVIRPEVFSDVQRSVLQWYSEQRLTTVFEEPHPFHWLWQDVQRYWRSIRSRACWLHAEQQARSLEVNFKLRSSRLVLIAAFLAALSRCSAHQPNPGTASCVRFLQNCLARTPLERLPDLDSQTPPTVPAADVDSPEIVRTELFRLYQQAWQRGRELKAQPESFGQSDRMLLTDLMKVVRRLAVTSDDAWIF